MTPGNRQIFAAARFGAPRFVRNFKIREQLSVGGGNPWLIQPLLASLLSTLMGWTMAGGKTKPGSSTEELAAERNSRVYMRLDQITNHRGEHSKFPGSAANINSASRALQRMLLKAEEWKMIGQAPKVKMMKEGFFFSFKKISIANSIVR